MQNIFEFITVAHIHVFRTSKQITPLYNMQNILESTTVSDVLRLCGPNNIWKSFFSDLSWSIHM